jgi:ferrous iron transport protein A
VQERKGVAVRLRDLQVGESAVVTGYEKTDAAYRGKLLAMGVTKGCVLKLVKIAPLGDPVKVEVRGYGLSLRRAEADALVVEEVR